jgi:Zn-dependent protease
MLILMEPERTPYDLNFGVFGVPVRVHPWFWLATALLGASALNEGIAHLLVWVGCVFISILIHELGHVAAYALFGIRSYIVLHSFGGLACGERSAPRRWQRIIVSLAGPLAGFLFLGLIFVVLFATGPYERGALSRSLVGEALGDLFFINLVWGLLNLLPIWPLDGGHICREICQGIAPRQGFRYSLMISTGVAGVLTLNYLIGALGREPLLPWLGRGSFYTVLFFGLLAFGSYQLLQQLGPPGGGSDDRVSWERRRDPWESDADAWK